MAHDRAVGFFFSVDYELRSDSERTILRILAAQPGASLKEIGSNAKDSSDAVTTSLSTLCELGLVEKDTEGRYEIASQFLRRWLADGANTPSDST